MKNDNRMMLFIAGFNHPLARMLSFFMAIFLSIFILIFPQHIARDLNQLDHGLLSLLMLAMCGCFVHGIGFRPYNRVAKIAFTPMLCWPLAGIAIWMWVL